MKNISTNYSSGKLNKILENASTVNETETKWIAYFDKDCRIDFDRYVSQFITAGTTITISKQKHKGYMGSFYKAVVSKK